MNIKQSLTFKYDIVAIFNLNIFVEGNKIYFRLRIGYT